MAVWLSLIIVGVVATLGWFLWQRARIARIGKCCGKGCGCVIRPPRKS